MILYKTFKVTEEKAINEFLMNHVPQENGIRMIGDNLIILYTSLDTDNKAQRMYNLSIGLGAVKESLNNNLFDLKVLRLNQKKKRGGKEKQDKLLNDIMMKENEINFGKDLVKVYEESIAELK